MPSNSNSLAGKYRLVAARWRQQLKVVDGKVVDWVDHVRGAIVDLDHETADRLLRAHAVEATNDRQASSDPAQTPDPAVQAAEASGLVAPVEAGDQPVPANQPAEPGK